MKLIPVENEPYLYRDADSKGIVCNDKNGLESYKNRRKVLLKQVKDIENLKKEVSEIKNELSQITTLLHNINNKI